jgi:hypothetical protein
MLTSFTPLLPQWKVHIWVVLEINPMIREFIENLWSLPLDPLKQSRKILPHMNPTLMWKQLCPPH